MPGLKLGMMAMAYGGYLLRIGCVVTAIASLTAMACSGDGELPVAKVSSVGEKEVPMSIAVTSTAFSEAGTIPTKYSCDGEDVSPPLSWSGTPEGTRSLALITDDPDASGIRTHWVLYGIPADVNELPEAMSTADITAIGAKNGTNYFLKLGYRGPCPPAGTWARAYRGDAHRYLFTLYALDIELELDSGAKKEELLEAMHGHILALGQLMGTW